MPTPEELERVKKIMLDRGYLKQGESVDDKVKQVTKEMDRVIRTGVIREKLQELENLKGAASMASEDLEQDSKFVADRKALQDELLLLEQERAAFDDLVGTMSRGTVNKVTMTGKEFIEGLRLLSTQFQDFFQLKDVFDLYDWCIKGDYTLQDALESVAQNRKTKLYLIRDLQECDKDENLKIHGAFLRQGLAVHYCEQMTKNGMQVELLETPIADHKQPTEMSSYELDLRDGRATPSGSFWTFDVDTFIVYPVHLKVLKPGDERMPLNEVERQKVVVVKQGAAAMLDKLIMEIRRAHKQAKLKFVRDLGNPNFYKLIVDPDA